MWNFKLTITRTGQKPCVYHLHKKTESEVKAEAFKRLPPHLNREAWKIVSNKNSSLRLSGFALEFCC